MRQPLVLASVLVIAAFLTGCSQASGELHGGESTFDASPPALADQDGGVCSDLDARSAADAGASHTWSDLYRDFFGVTGKASCAGDGACHGGPTEEGTTASQFECGKDEATCYDGMTKGSGRLVTPGDTSSDPKFTSLYLTLRQTCRRSGNMPRRPDSVSFSPAEMDRIASWIREGSPKTEVAVYRALSPMPKILIVDDSAKHEDHARDDASRRRVRSRRSARR